MLLAVRANGVHGWTRSAASERGDFALERAIALHREKVQHYLDNGQATQAVEEYERLLAARRRLADWQRRTAQLRAS